MTTVGYGDVGPTTSSERIFIILLMLFGVFVFSTVTGMLASVLQSADESAVEKVKIES